jgi:hypothetical protein
MSKTDAVVFLQRLRCVGMEVEGPGSTVTGYRFDVMALYGPDESRPEGIDAFNAQLNLALCSIGGRAAREGEPHAD